MPPDPIHTQLALLKVLADESRLRVLGFLAHEERTPGQLAEALGLKQPTVSHHLSRLRRAGLVTRRAEGNSRVYRLNFETLTGLGRDLTEPDRIARWTGFPGPLSFDAKVMKAFVDGERLVSIPASRRKRDVVLRWLVTFFERDRDYPEREVDQILFRHHPDWATLRRELVGAKLMTRDRGIYRRTGSDHDH